MEYFDYEVTDELKGSRNLDEQLLKNFGLAGWELVTIIQAPSSIPEGPTKFLGYFKKPKKG